MTSFKRHSYLNSFRSPPIKKIVENVIDLSQHAEIDLSRFRQVYKKILFADFLLLSETCFRLVGNLSETCRKHVADYVENVFSTR